MTEPDGYVVDFPTLWVAVDWIEAHCWMPSAMAEPRPMEMYDWQLWCTANHYRVRPDALTPGTVKPAGDIVSVASAFMHRRSQVVAPQKTGKGPWSASIVCAEAVGPVTFAGWAAGGESYRCRDWGCSCGWEFDYQPGEPMGVPWVRPLIQLLATSEDQTDNVFAPLQTMIRSGPLVDLLRVGEGFIRTPNDGKIDPVTAKAQSKLGNPVTFVLQDETGLYTKSNGLVKVAQTQRRGLGGMGGRSMETTNPWDPAENSVAQQTFEGKALDVFKFYRKPPANLSFKDKRERREILRFAYKGSDHVDLDSIEAEAAELMETDPEQAERFYGNRLVQGLGSWLPEGLWAGALDERPMPADGTEICLGFDGSDADDWTAIRARTLDGFHFTPTYGTDGRPTFWNPAQYGGQIPRTEVHAAIDELCTRYKVVRAYCDPFGWQTDIGDWAIKYGEKVFLEWTTGRPKQMHEALAQYVADLVNDRISHDNCKDTEAHIFNAKKVSYPGQRYMLGKPHGAYHQKIDLAMADVLAHKAGEDARLAGWNGSSENNFVYFPD